LNSPKPRERLSRLMHLHPRFDKSSHKYGSTDRSVEGDNRHAPSGIKVLLVLFPIRSICRNFLHSENQQHNLHRLPAQFVRDYLCVLVEEILEDRPQMSSSSHVLTTGWRRAASCEPPSLSRRLICRFFGALLRAPEYPPVQSWRSCRILWGSASRADAYCPTPIFDTRKLRACKRTAGPFPMIRSCRRATMQTPARRSLGGGHLNTKQIGAHARRACAWSR
jgi:hypothetical protein